MRLLTAVLLLVSAMSAEQAQWQTVRIFSLSDKTYKEYLLAQNQTAKQIGNPVAVTDTHLRLSKGKDPEGYREFAQGFQKKIEEWAKTADIFRSKAIEIVLQPYGIEPSEGDVQVQVVWYRGPGILPFMSPISLRINDGLEVAIKATKIAIAKLQNLPAGQHSHR